MRGERTEEERFAEQAVPDDSIDLDLAQRMGQQREMRDKYRDHPDYYALLTSFYTAFVAPIEQEIAIAEAAEELQLTALEVGPDQHRTTLLVAPFNRPAAQAALAQITQAFAALGVVLFPQSFTLTDFLRDVRNQDQDNY